MRTLVLSCMLLANIALADESCVVVIYPELREPYQTVLEEIIHGIEQESKKVQRISVSSLNEKHIQNSLKNASQCDAVIGLARSGIQKAKSFFPHLPIVAGATLTQPGEPTSVPTISLTPAPFELFKRLKHFNPDVKSVMVVYNPSNNAYLINLARQAAEELGIKLSALKAQNLKEAVILYENILRKMNPEYDALWLIHDPSTMDSSVVLALVLELAWKRKLIIFSSRFSHASNGVLFSVYPDNIKLGHHLAELAQKCVNKACQKNKVLSLRELGAVVNRRTARRLNITIDELNDPYVNMVVPAR